MNLNTNFNLNIGNESAKFKVFESSEAGFKARAETSSSVDVYGVNLDVNDGPLYQQRSPLVSKKPGGATDEQ